MERTQVIVASVVPVGTMAAYCLATQVFDVILCEAGAYCTHDLRVSSFQLPTLEMLDELVSSDMVEFDLSELDADDVDTLIQVGTNLSAIRLAAEHEQTLEKPIIAINSSSYWHALRTNTLNDQFSGDGGLIEEH